ncbi:MAG: septal ring lytic transglycosylase RlpA family protein [Verrucomicrobiales bacterium]|nr:septal ring lytic transglycosylase RlpA family protein [Verrucomicrobiales bacterium]
MFELYEAYTPVDSPGATGVPAVKLEVTNLANSRSAIVRINDRGPFVGGRIIGVSIGVAGKLDFVGRGVVPLSNRELLEPSLRRDQ